MIMRAFAIADSTCSVSGKSSGFLTVLILFSMCAGPSGDLCCLAVKMVNLIVLSESREDCVPYLQHWQYRLQLRDC
ncbi:hypothetical protein F5880DRAFT_1535910 [Lentinula raphanica]|nr:hypothetical protein F5880DRAFT_1535910 [Lentinula raphanica]